MLYIGTSGVYRLTGDGTLHWVVGSNLARLNKEFKTVYSNPAVQGDFTPATRLAFDGVGDLLVAGGGGWGLYERTSAGKLRFVESFRGGGYWGSLATTPGGGVVLAGGNEGLGTFHPSGVITPRRARALNHVLGPHDSFRIGLSVAVAPNGDLYLDTDAGNGFTSNSAIISLSPDGSAKLIWKGPTSN